MKYYKVAIKDSNNMEIKEGEIDAISDKLIFHTELKDIEGYTIFFEIYKCRLSKEFIETTKEYPIYYISIMYNKSIIIGSLFQYYLLFDAINNTFYYSLKNNNEIDEKKFYKKINIYNSKKEIKEYLISLKDNLEFLELIKNGIIVRNENRNKNNDMFSYQLSNKIINLKAVHNNPTLLDNYL